MVVLGVLAIIVVPLIGATATVLGAAVIMGIVGYGSWYLFDTQKLLLDPSAPLITMLMLTGTLIITNYIREERRRREIRGAFGQYVSPDLVSQLSEDGAELKLGGQTRELTLLFSDVRGFTAISERFRDDPQGLTLLMNRFLTVLSNAILDQRGTIDKFMGDAVMAFWNAPLPTENHQAASCRAEIDMLARTAELNEQLPDDTPRINVGIGLNTGTCVVGNMGSYSRFDYTALGDTVNLASRLDGQSKTYGVGTVVGESTAEVVSDTFALIELDLIRVKGNDEPARIFGLLGDETLRATDAFARVAETNAAMLEAYRGRDWDGAEALLDTLESIEIEPGLPMYIELWRKRVADAKANPPGPDWDGVYTAASK